MDHATLSTVFNVDDIPRSDVLARIRKDYTRGQVDRDVAAIDGAVRLLESEREALMAIRPLLPDDRDDAQRTNTESPDQPPAAHAVAPARRQHTRRGGTQEAIRAIMREPEARPWWRPPAMRKALLDRGFEASTNLVGVSMRRMADRGELRRNDDGDYALPESGHTQQEALA